MLKDAGFTLNKAKDNQKVMYVWINKQRTD